MATRMVDKCTKCGHLSERFRVIAYDYVAKYECAWCHNKECIEVEYPAFETDEVDIIRKSNDELLYILNKAFNAIRPKETDCFGCIEMCDYLKKKYELGDEIYELAGAINAISVSNYEHADFVPEYGRLSASIGGIHTDDGRSLMYQLIYYSSSVSKSKDEIYYFINEEDFKVIEDDIRGKLLEIIDNVVKFRPYTTGKGETAFPCADFDYDFEMMKQAREKVINIVKPQTDRKIANETRNRIVEEMTKPVKNTDPNYVESATCPNCHKNSVYRISNVKRGASIGLFGLFSKNIGKTMECRSCGYKW